MNYVLSALIVVVITSLYLFIREWLYNKCITNKSVSFKEAMDLTELPVVTFYQGEEKFNFLLDTGSNESYIDKSVATRLKGKFIENSLNIHGIGNGNAHGSINAVLEYKKNKFEALIYITEHLKEAFAAVKEESGVNIHGIIGNQFLKKHGYILDFVELIAYNKK